MDGFAIRCHFKYFKGLQALPLRMTRRLKFYPLMTVLVQRMFVPANRVIALGIYCRYCIRRRLILTELVFGGHDAQQSATTADPSSQGLAGLR